jgi:uncharacterized phiE125 gp8 family phage protein
MNLKIITAPTIEPVSLAEAKLHLRVTTDEDNNLISSLITVAREICENITNRALATQTLELSLDRFPNGNIVLPYPPLISVTSIYYKNSAGVNTQWLPITEYIVDTAKEPGEIVLAYGKSYPSFTEYPTNAIKIIFIAGYTTDIPLSIKQAMLILCSHFYENREEFVIGQTVTKIPRAVDSLLYPYRIFSF